MKFHCAVDLKYQCDAKDYILKLSNLNAGSIQISNPKWVVTSESCDWSHGLPSNRIVRLCCE